MISVKVHGNNNKTKRSLKNALWMSPMQIMQKYADIGLNALKEATPKKTGLTASSWYYEITKEAGMYYLNYYNSNIQDGVRVAVILDLGHGTGTGGYVRGLDYIDPAIRPVFNDIANRAWREVTDA